MSDVYGNAVIAQCQDSARGLWGDVGVAVVGNHANHAIVGLPRDDAFTGSPRRGFRRKYTWCWLGFGINLCELGESGVWCCGN